MHDDSVTKPENRHTPKRVVPRPNREMRRKWLRMRSPDGGKHPAGKTTSTRSREASRQMQEWKDEQR